LDAVGKAALAELSEVPTVGKMDTEPRSTLRAKTLPFGEMKHSLDVVSPLMREVANWVNSSSEIEIVWEIEAVILEETFCCAEVSQDDCGV
jgi:hypothetical protein